MLDAVRRSSSREVRQIVVLGDQDEALASDSTLSLGSERSLSSRCLKSHAQGTSSRLPSLFQAEAVQRAAQVDRRARFRCAACAHGAGSMLGRARAHAAIALADQQE